jgi:dynein light chain Tctex-type 1
MNAFDDNADGDNSVFFDKEVIAPLVSGIVNDILIKETYDDAKTQVLIDQICGRSMAALADLQLGMKFVCSCIIVQNNGAGWGSATSAYSSSTDDIFIYHWPDRKLKEAATCNLNCVTTVAGFVV